MAASAARVRRKTGMSPRRAHGHAGSPERRALQAGGGGGGGTGGGGVFITKNDEDEEDDAVHIIWISFTLLNVRPDA